MHFIQNALTYLNNTTALPFFSLRSRRSRGGERKRRGLADPPHHPQLKKWHNLRQKVTHMILQPGKLKEAYEKSTMVVVYFIFLLLTGFSPLFKHRTSLDQTTLNQTVSVNGVHSDNDTSQVRHSIDSILLSVTVFVLCCTDNYFKDFQIILCVMSCHVFSPCYHPWIYFTKSVLKFKRETIV